jgi:hypothetical protein
VALGPIEKACADIVASLPIEVPTSKPHDQRDRLDPTVLHGTPGGDPPARCDLRPDD